MRTVEIPVSVGRYPIERALGSGAFASVWLGRDDRLDSYVAIKVLAENWSVEPAVRERFLKEARLLRAADSPHIVQVHDIGELPDGRPYFVMTYADMGTLAGRLAEGALPVSEALRLIGEIAVGVGELHSLGIVHRDLKPSNVLFRSVTGGGERAMVADLGVARALADATSHTITAGTPGYMAPEQMRLDGAPDARADVHGLGAMAYHLLTGEVPGTGAVRLAPHRLRKEVPERVSTAVMRAIDPDPWQRWQSVAEFVEALNQDRPGPVAVQRRPAASTPFTPVRVGIGAVLVALAVTGTVVALRMMPTTGTASATVSPNASPAAVPTGLREDAGIPPQYRKLIIQAGTWCVDVKGLSPALIAGLLKVESDFDADLNDPDKDEYGIVRWTPSVLQHWQPGELKEPIPTPPLSPELSIPALGKFFCTLGPQISSLPGDPAGKLVALYRSGVVPMKRANGVPPQWKDHVARVMKYRDEYQTN
ncbi:protein kinase [Nonomuraea sp. NBC_01738]|uniref:serine/threonine-protein kinase n=1 Tax=Nonomuraea sp. NBC_01738 TaxID=2976003 RepID=UPI002E0F68E6|nr:protein kinase [Nonomuraea sp. NBC_01738]